MDHSFDSLDPRFKPKAIELVARVVEARIHVLILNTRRTDAEQAACLAARTSWTAHSLHQDGLAIDLVPYELWQANGVDKLNWDAAAPVWQQIGVIGEKLGLKWGGRWPQRDMGHFEFYREWDHPARGPETLFNGYVG